MVAQRVVVLDNGGCTCKIGFAGEEEPLKCAMLQIAFFKSLPQRFP